ncbi:DUF2550 domain-containing protein [Quadrisphaera sp. DSM 44207]|uniref:DUF2550 domain-containing protein n=1 Tax=Quadrisphaera sp. DSM 44207 TaxID=1881057 RepID=UPI000B84ED00
MVLAVAVAAALVVLVLVLFALRRWLLTRTRGAFDCSVRLQGRPGARAGRGRQGRGWSQGVARFGSDRVDWWKVFSLSPRPGGTWARDDLSVVERRPPGHGEVDAVLPDAVVVRCCLRGRPLELAMTQEAYTGFASWLEAAPPGPRSRVT